MLQYADVYSRQHWINVAVEQTIAGKLHIHLTQILNSNSDQSCQGVTL